MNIRDLDLTALYDLADKCIGIYHDEIRRINAIGFNHGLVNSTADWQQTGPDEITMYFKLPSYYVYVEEGREPSRTRVNPPYVYQQILKWINAKNITPRPTRRQWKTKKGEVRYGKMHTPTKEQLAWMIYRKIHKVGYYNPNHVGKHPLENTLRRMAIEGLGQEAVNKIAKGFGKELHAEVLSLADYKKK